MQRIFVNFIIYLQTKSSKGNGGHEEGICTDYRAYEEKREEKMEQYTQDILSQVFTLGQIRILMKSHKKRVKWFSEDISAILLRCVSPKAYRYLRNVIKKCLSLSNPQFEGGFK